MLVCHDTTWHQVVITCLLAENYKGQSLLWGCGSSNDCKCISTENGLKKAKQNKNEIIYTKVLLLWSAHAYIHGSDGFPIVWIHF